MNEVGQQRNVGQTPPRPTRSRPATWPLSRRVFAGLLGLVPALGLSSKASHRTNAGGIESTPTTPAGTLGLGIIGIHVTDLAASFDFYRRLGLAIPIDVDLSEGAFRLPLSTGQIFFWETIDYTQQYFPDYERGTGQRKVSLEFGFEAPAAVDAMYEALLANGYGSYFEPTSWGDIRYAGVLDPDDNQIALRYPLVS